jgi:hypothetical protein
MRRQDNKCQVGDFGVHLYDRSTKLEVTHFDGSLVYVRFSANGTPRPMIREELLFPWDIPKVKKEEKRFQKKRYEDDEEYED